MSGRISELAAELGVPADTLVHGPGVDTGGTPEMQTFVEALVANPNWQAIEEILTDEAARLCWQVISMQPGHDRAGHAEDREVFLARRERMIGEVLGMIRVLEAPNVTHRAIVDRRER